MIIYNKSTIERFWSAMLYRFCVRSTSKRWFLKHDPFDAMLISM